jgi:hypothetical protein
VGLWWSVFCKLCHWFVFHRLEFFRLQSYYGHDNVAVVLTTWVFKLFVDTFLGALAKLRKASFIFLVFVCFSICLCVCPHETWLTGFVYVNIYIWAFIEIVLKNLMFFLYCIYLLPSTQQTIGYNGFTTTCFDSHESSSGYVQNLLVLAVLLLTVLEVVGRYEQPPEL